MKNYILKLLKEVLRENPDIVGKAVSESIIEIDPAKRYLLLFPGGDKADHEYMADLIDAVSPADKRNIFAIFADGVKILELS